MNKGGVIAISAIVAGGALLAFTGKAKASTKPKGDSSATDAGFKGPNKVQCQKWYDERVQVINTVSQLNGTIASIDNDIAEYNAASGGFGTPEDLIKARQAAVNQRSIAQARANQLAVLMQDCE